MKFSKKYGINESEMIRLMHVEGFTYDKRFMTIEKYAHDSVFVTFGTYELEYNGRDIYLYNEYDDAIVRFVEDDEIFIKWNEAALIEVDKIDGLEKLMNKI